MAHQYAYGIRIRLALQTLEEKFPQLKFSAPLDRPVNRVFLVNYNCECHRAMTYVAAYSTLEQETTVDDFIEATRADAYFCPHLNEIGHTTPQHTPSLASRLAEREMQKTRPWPHCPRPEWDAQHDALVERLSKEATTIMGTPYQVFVERNVACRELEMTLRCGSCREYATGAVYEQRAEERADWADVLLRNLINVTGDDGTCRCVDGLTPERCLQWFSFVQRCDRDAFQDRCNRHLYRLTPRQLDLARSEWSASLRAKQEQAREKERVAICVDDDRWEE